MCQIITTGDGSPTVLSEGGLSYHSTRGAVQESQHVFIHAGLMPAFAHFAHSPVISVFEMGFGTGLNTFLTAAAACEAVRTIHYTAIEAQPLPPEVWERLNYATDTVGATSFTALHQAAWFTDYDLHSCFTLQKVKGDLLQFDPQRKFHLVYYDAFAPDDQPELWTEAIFSKMYAAMHEGGILTTYCAKGQVRRNMLGAGFRVDRIPGPPGKREMMRAVKPS